MARDDDKKEYRIKVLFETSLGMIDLWTVKTIIKGRDTRKVLDEHFKEQLRAVYTIEINKFIDEPKGSLSKPIVLDFIEIKDRDAKYDMMKERLKIAGALII